MIYLGIVLFILFIPFLGAMFLYIYRKGCKIDVSIERAFFKEKSNSSELCLDFQVVNKGHFHSIILNVDAGFLPVINFINKKILSNGKDYYFDTVILKSGKSFNFKVIFELPKEVLHKEELEKLKCFVNLCYYDLKPIRFFYKEFSINDLATNQETEIKESVGVKEDDFMDEIKLIEKENVFCLKTPIITHYDGVDYVVSLINKGIGELKNIDKKFKGVAVCIAESLIAIIQGRVGCVYSIVPSSLAQLFNHYFNEDSSLSSPYALELVLRDIGFFRFYFSLYPGIIGKVLRRRGWFYIFAGRKAAAVDDAGGTVRPYDKFVVLAPDKPDEISMKIKDKINQSGFEIDVFIVDANDLGKVDILGSTNREMNKKIIDYLRSNPQGNDDEQTPIVFIPIH